MVSTCFPLRTAGSQGVHSGTGPSFTTITELQVLTLSLNGLQVGEQIVDLGWIELELRRRWVASRDTFGKSLQILNRKESRKRPEQRRFGNGAGAVTADDMTFGAVGLGKGEAALHTAGCRRAGRPSRATKMRAASDRCRLTPRDARVARDGLTRRP